MREKKEKKEAILKEVLRLLGERYPCGLYEFIYKYKPELYNKLTCLENEIDRGYLDDSVTIEGFKAILREYWKFHMEAIQEFNQAGLILNLAKAKQEMAEERIRA